MTPATRIISLSCLNLVLLSGCTYTQGYAGPELARGEVARVSFYSPGDTSLGDIRVGNSSKGYFDSGIDLLPGSYNFNLDFLQEGTDCSSPYASAFGCAEAKYEGNCTGSIRVSSGHEYSVRAIGSGGALYLEVGDVGDNSPAGSGTCTKTGVRYIPPKMPARD